MLGGSLAAIALIALMCGSTLLWGPAPTLERLLGSLFGGIAAAVVALMLINAVTPISESAMSSLGLVWILLAGVLGRAGRDRLRRTSA